MAVEVRWDDVEQAIIRIDLLGRWKWDEFYTALDGVRPLMMNKTTVVHLIAVVENATYVPANPLFHASNFLRSAPSNLGQMIIVGANQFAAPFLPIASRFYPQVVSKIQFATTIDEAKTMLQQT
ncbi:MAG: hypothetical protein U0694_03090 [Anaerolineae bacterium]